METSLVAIVKEQNLEPTKSEVLLSKFTTYFEQAKELEQKARTIVVTDVAQVAEMKQAREARLMLKGIRVEAEKTRVSLKEQSLREGKAIDGIANVIKALVVPIEEYLENQEKFAERIEEERKAKILNERTFAVSQYVLDTSVYNLRDMNDDGFAQLIASLETAKQLQLEAEKKAQEELNRIESERKAEEERIRKENEELKKEREAREKEIAIERAKAEAELKKQEEARQKEREAREKVEAELRKKEEDEKKAKAEAEAKVIAERLAQEEEERKALLAPDKEKIAAYAQRIKELEAPKGLSKEAQAIIDQAEKELLATVQKMREAYNNI